MKILQTILPMSEQKPVILDQYLLLKIVGMLAFGLPVVLWLLAAWREEICMQGSISEFYFTPFAGDVFVGALVFIGLFLFSYRGWQGDLLDNQLASAAGIFAFGTAFIPTLGSPCTDIEGRARAFLPTGAGADPDQYLFFGEVGAMLNSENVHLVLAGLFLATIGSIVMFRFTKTNKRKKMSPQKKKRNMLYYFCGAIIFLCIILVAFQDKLNLPIGDNQTFKLEFVALWAFGIAWMTKGELLKFMNDS